MMEVLADGAEQMFLVGAKHERGPGILADMAPSRPADLGSRLPPG